MAIGAVLRGTSALNEVAEQRILAGSAGPEWLAGFGHGPGQERLGLVIEMHHFAVSSKHGRCAAHP